MLHFSKMAFRLMPQDMMHVFAQGNSERGAALLIHSLGRLGVLGDAAHLNELIDAYRWPKYRQRPLARDGRPLRRHRVPA